MTRSVRECLVALGCGALLLSAPAGSTGQPAADPQIDQGRYLVHHVAMCVQCHSPRGQGGALVGERLLQGGRIPVSRPFATMNWSLQTPRLIGLAGLSESDVVTLLMTGARANGQPPQPPMPPFRMSEEDARAVVAYLRSLD